MRRKLLGVFALGLLAVQANAAQVTYSYEGQQLDPLDPSAPPDLVAAIPSTVSNITATIVLSAPVVPGAQATNYQALSFQMSDGATTITGSTPGYVRSVWLEADVDGQIIGWAIRASDTRYINDGSQGIGIGQFVDMYTFGGDVFEDHTRYCGGVFPITGGCTAYPNRNAFWRGGSWTITVVPVPSGFFLLCSAFGVMGWCRRKNTG